MSYIGVLSKVIFLKLFLDIVPSSSADITRAFRGCFRGGSVYVSFLSVSIALFTVSFSHLHYNEF